MRRLTSLLTCGLILALFVSAGCSPNTSLEAQRRRSRQRITELESDLQTARDENTRLKGELTSQQALAWKMQEEAQVQKAEFEKLSAELDAMAERAGRTGPLPDELDAMLTALAETNSELLSYDPLKGRVRLKSDATFTLASDESDEVEAQAKPVLAALAQICSSELAQDCQILIVGHTDDLPIVRPQTKAKHPTNWHLSVHRAIAVMDVLKESMSEDRLAVMGFGQYRPIADNLPDNKGNPSNGRVEIFIVPEDVEMAWAGLK